MPGQKLKIFKRQKNREDGSDFNEIRTKKIAATQAVWWKIFERSKRMKSSRKIRKMIVFFRKIQKIDNVDVISY